MSNSRQKVIRRWLDQAEKEGWRVKLGGKHYRMYPPDKDVPSVTIPASPGRGRAMANIRAQLRRCGLEVEV
jgi:hypothetical protein